MSYYETPEQKVEKTEVLEGKMDDLDKRIDLLEQRLLILCGMVFLLSLVLWL